MRGQRQPWDRQGQTQKLPQCSHKPGQPGATGTGGSQGRFCLGALRGSGLAHRPAFHILTPSTEGFLLLVEVWGPLLWQPWDTRGQLVLVELDHLTWWSGDAAFLRPSRCSEPSLPFVNAFKEPYHSAPASPLRLAPCSASLRH